MMPAISSNTSYPTPPKVNPTYWSDDSSELHQGLKLGDNSTSSMLVVIDIVRFNYVKEFFILSGQNHHQHSSQSTISG
eukprot:1480336-Amphidinium_carterae.1